MNLDHDFVQVSKLNKDQKKKSLPKMEHFLSPNSGEDPPKKVFTKNRTLFCSYSRGHLRSNAHQSQIIGGDADVDHTQTIGGIQSNYWGGVYPPHPPRVSAPLTAGVVLPNFEKNQ